MTICRVCGVTTDDPENCLGVEPVTYGLHRDAEELKRSTLEAAEEDHWERLKEGRRLWK